MCSGICGFGWFSSGFGYWSFTRFSWFWVGFGFSVALLRLLGGFGFYGFVLGLLDFVFSGFELGVFSFWEVGFGCLPTLMI